MDLAKILPENGPPIEEVSKYIKKYKNEIVDKKRIIQILKNINLKSKNKNIDPKITNKIWKAMIKAFIEYEYRNFKKR